MIATADLAWIAALVEGEGYLGFSRTAQGCPTPRIVIHMADRDVIERLAGFWGCVVRPRKKQQPHHKQQYKAQVNSAAAIAWAATLYPWLGARRRSRVREMLLAWKHSAKPYKYRTHCPKGHAYAGRNLIVRKRGGRACRACLYAAVKRWDAAHARGPGRLTYMQQWRREHPERLRAYRQRARRDDRQLTMAL